MLKIIIKKCKHGKIVYKIVRREKKVEQVTVRINEAVLQF